MSGRCTSYTFMREYTWCGSRDEERTSLVEQAMRKPASRAEQSVAQRTSGSNPGLL